MAWWQEIKEQRPEWQATTLPFQEFTHSFVSASPHSDRISISYFKDHRSNKVGAKVWFGELAEGPPRHAHGGAQASVLDEVCGGAAWLNGLTVVAANLNVSFRNMCPLRQDIFCLGWIEKKEGKKILTRGELRDGEGKLIAESEVLFILLDEARMAELRAGIHQK